MGKGRGDGGGGGDDRAGRREPSLTGARPRAGEVRIDADDPRAARRGGSRRGERLEPGFRPSLSAIPAIA